eukprot:m.91236 g.91236  ORF g.91236 m.91236 type:complete len:53 (+) comp26452_c2_seq1:2171-2329(+)
MSSNEMEDEDVDYAQEAFENMRFVQRQLAHVATTWLHQIQLGSACKYMYEAS